MVIDLCYDSASPWCTITQGYVVYSKAVDMGLHQSIINQFDIIVAKFY